MKHPSGKVLVATENARFFHLASDALKQRGFKLVHAKPSQAAGSLPVITTASERPFLPARCENVFVYDDVPTVDREQVQVFTDIVKIALDPAVTKAERVSVDIGIDPGEKITGLCLLVNGKVVEATRVPADLPRIVQFVRKGIQAAYTQGEDPAITIKIGNGEPVTMTQIVDHLLSLDESQSFSVEIVDEFQSNAGNGRHGGGAPTAKMGEHERAAVFIATREGESARATLEREGQQFSKKQLKKVQHESRERTNQLHRGISIDKQAASKVLSGEQTLDDAINESLARHRGTSSRPP